MKKQNHLLFILSLLITLFLTACNGNNEKSTDTIISEKTDTMKFSFTEKPYGTFNNDPVKQYTIINPAGVELSIINYGGNITGIITPDREGNKGNVLLGFNSLEGYLQKGNPFFGALVGRYGNRIANAKFILDGKTYTLAANNNKNSLHGGLKGFDKVIWAMEKLPGDSSLQLSYLSKDGEEGYPGNLNVKVIYSLSSNNEVGIEYSATTDKATPVNLTNHSYFNLSAGKDPTILAHKVMINADKFTEVNDDLIPTGKLPDVKGTPMDFTTEKAIGRDIDKVKGGYDHNWVLTKSGSDVEKAASAYDSASGRFMEVFTSQPGVQFYTGNFLGTPLTNTLNGKNYVKHAGFCMETQHYPDSPNQPSFPSTILKPGETYKQKTVYKFSVR